MGFPGGSDSKDSACNAGDPGSIPGLGRFPGKGNGWLPMPIFLPEEFHGQRSLVGYSPRGQQELDTTELTGIHHTVAVLFLWTRKQTANN